MGGDGMEIFILAIVAFFAGLVLIISAIFNKSLAFTQRLEYKEEYDKEMLGGNKGLRIIRFLGGILAIAGSILMIYSL